MVILILSCLGSLSHFGSPSLAGLKHSQRNLTLVLALLLANTEENVDWADRRVDIWAHIVA